MSILTVVCEYFNLAALRINIDQIPGGAIFLRCAAAIEDEGKMASAQVSDAVAVGMAMEKELDLGKSLEDVLERFSANETFSWGFISKKRKVVEEDHIVILGKVI